MGEWGPGEEVLCAQRAPTLSRLVSLKEAQHDRFVFHIRTVACQVIKVIEARVREREREQERERDKEVVERQEYRSCG